LQSLLYFFAKSRRELNLKTVVAKDSCFSRYATAKDARVKDGGFILSLFSRKRVPRA
jgi:hypothetical protein